VPDAASSREHSGAPLLEARGVSKRFGAVRALDEVSCSIRAGACG